MSLNAPFGARCFLTTRGAEVKSPAHSRLNAPFGAWCFLTTGTRDLRITMPTVLMRLMALGAF